MSKTALIVGAGPAGLTAACELLDRSAAKVVVIEADAQVGGISKTINYRGNRMDLGGHRFFSKSDWVMQWWQRLLPVAPQEDTANSAINLQYQGQSRPFAASSVAAAASDNVMLIRSRLSRIYYRRKFFDYPLKLSWSTLANLGPAYTAAIGASYLASRMRQRQPERTLEDFLINRFGRKLYLTFFKDYTEKVWGVPCHEIAAEWGAQRIKGLSITKALVHALSKPFKSRDTAQKNTETSLIERFLYPKYGPGQMWEQAAARVTAAGGSLLLRHKLCGIRRRGQRIEGVEVEELASGQRRFIAGDYLISSMPIKDLTELLQPEDPVVCQIAASLPYRDFMTAGLLVRRMQQSGAVSENGGSHLPPDNWIYIQEPDVKLGRLQIFNNWSPALVADPNTVWLGLEYFCAEGDELWAMSDDRFLAMAGMELAKIGLIRREDILDGTVVRVPKAYPAYFGNYRHIGQVRSYLDSIENLYPVGRNGMHRYNNQDHSMLAAKAAVDCIIAGATDRSALWSVNVEDEYHEINDRKASSIRGAAPA